MQDDIKDLEDEKKELEAKKVLLIQGAAKVAKGLRKIGKTKFCSKHNLQERSLSKLEKGTGDLQMTTICRIAHAYGLKYSEFIKLVEDELPEDFNFDS